MKTLTNSSLTSFKTCPRKYELQYELGYVPVRESEPLFFGKLFHFGLEVWAKNNKNIGLMVAQTEQYFMAARNEDQFLLCKIVALLEGYHERYKNEEFEVVGSELQFKTPVLNPKSLRASKSYVLEGVIDRLLKDKNGRFILLETKTTSENIEDPASDYWSRLGLDSQLSTYFLGAESLGFKIETCLYDVIRKPTIKPKKEETPQQFYDRLSADIAERPSFYYARREIPRTKNDLVSFFNDVWGVSQVLSLFQKNKSFPRYTNACRSNYGYCQYFAVCSGQATLEDHSLFKKTENKHPELEMEEKNEIQERKYVTN